MSKDRNIRRTLHYYWQATKEHKILAFLTFSLTPAVIILRDIVAPFLMAEIVGQLASNPSWNYIGQDILPLAIWFLIVHIIKEVANILRCYVEWDIAIYAMNSLANMSFDAIASQSMQFHNNKFSGSLVSQANKFVSAYERLMDTLSFEAIPFLTLIVSAIFVLFINVPAYAAGLLVLVIIYISIAYYFFRKMMPLNQTYASAENKRTGQLADSITNINSVKSYAGETHERARYADFSRKSARAYLNMSHLSVKRHIFFSLVYFGFNLIVVFFVLTGQRLLGLDYSLLFLMVSYTTSIFNRLWDVNQIFRSLNRVFGDAYEMTEILDLPDDVVDSPSAKELQITDAAISFSNITFKHADAKTTIFHEFNLEVRPGERIGLVGVSGSGKTTLTKLLLRFADVASGAILIDGQNIGFITQHSLRRAIAYVPQETALFHRSIAENISYGKPKATMAEIQRAAKLANAHEFIEELPDGYNSLVGERGIKLSGGQRQRIAIARAILKNAPILVLDEATSALDSESEAMIQDALGKLMKDRTCIVIAHRLSTVASLDRIVVLNNGRIVETGTHAELLKAGGAYAKLWSRQSGAFIK